MAKTYSMSDADHERVSAAVHAAELGTAGEIVTIIADRSDQYLDVALWWSAFVAALALVALAAFPDFYLGLVTDMLSNGWQVEWKPADVLELAFGVMTIKFFAMRLLLIWMPLRLWLTPRFVKARRVRRRAIRYFKVGAERRTQGRTGVLVYLSMGEHVAEIVADEAIHGKVAPGAWGDAMGKLVAEVREGRVADGMIAAIGDIGAILAQHFPRAEDDVNELPDRLIEL